jgi:hypothetical protein
MLLIFEMVTYIKLFAMRNLRENCLAMLVIQQETFQNKRLHLKLSNAFLSMPKILQFI